VASAVPRLRTVAKNASISLQASSPPENPLPKAPDAPHQLVAGIDTWSEVTRANPLLDSLSPDAEALLVYKRPDGVECHLVPVATSPVRARADKARFPTMTG